MSVNESSAALVSEWPGPGWPDVGEAGVCDVWLAAGMVRKSLRDERVCRKKVRSKSGHVKAGSFDPDRLGTGEMHQ